MNESDIPQVIEALEMLLTVFAPQAVVYFAVVKGLAAYFNNNVDTTGWNPKLRKLMDFLASADKKAKMTGDPEIDKAVKDYIWPEEREQVKVSKDDFTSDVKDELKKVGTTLILKKLLKVLS